MTSATAIPNRRIALTFMAHPDDAEILCGGTLIRLARLGWQVHIATAARGDCGSATLGPEKIAAIRLEEGRRAAQSIGATYHCLGLDDVCVTFCEQTIRQSIDLFRRIAPTLVFTHPRFDYMLDHEQAHLLARAATFSYPIPNASALPQVEGAQVPWLYYVDPLEGLDPYSGKMTEPTTLINVSAVMEDKAAMLSCHASQRDWLRSHHGMDEYIEAMKRHGATRGQTLSVAFAEAFTQHRGHAYPHSDLLTDLLASKGNSSCGRSAK